MSDFTFWLGTHHPHWLADERVNVPLFVAHTRILGCDKPPKTLPRAINKWMCDSGAFSEITLHGSEAFIDGPGPYIAALRRYRDEIGMLHAAAQQDWMCEPNMLDRTGFIIPIHQGLTTDNLFRIRDEAPDLVRPDGTHLVFPSLQGWHPDDYRRHRDQLTARGIDLTREPIVGLGSVCRRGHETVMVDLVRELHDDGIRLHTFGYKTKALRRVAPWVASADSLAWSDDARWQAYTRKIHTRVGQYELDVPAVCGTGAHQSCANCREWALRWRRNLLRSVGAPTETEAA